MDDITDIIGCRIITYFADDVDKIAFIIEKEFDVDKDNSVDKRKVEYDRFGYQSLHFVASLNKSRLKLTEYKQFKNLKFEIQIRSILQHSWAEIEHDIGYKGKYSIPDIAKRRFSRIAALLETADLEFVALRNELASYEKHVKKEIKDNPDNVTLDKASLLSFISTDNNLKKTDSVVAKILHIDLQHENSVIESLLLLLEFAGIKTIHDLQKNYQDQLECVIDFANKWREPKNTAVKGKGALGISLYDLSYLLIARKRSKSELLEFFNNQDTDYARDWQRSVDKVFNAFEQIDQNCK